MINAVFEGESDRATAEAVIQAAGRTVNRLYSTNGKSTLDTRLHKYVQAAQHGGSWVVFRDSDSECPVQLQSRLMSGITDVSPAFLLRIVHPMTEAWLMADRAGFAEYFGVRPTQIPGEPEVLPHPKRTLLELCQASRKRPMREEMVASQLRAGPLYTVHLNEFARTAWNVDVAASNSDSLSRAIRRISAMS